MQHHVRLWSVLVPLLVAGCTGRFYHGPAHDLAANSSGIEPGIVYYPPITVVEQFAYTVHVAKSGAVDAASNKIGHLPLCTQVPAQSIVANIPNTSNPQRLIYKPGLLETYTLKVQFNKDGTLSSINSTSTPDQGKTLKNVTSAITSLIPSMKSLFEANITGKPPQGVACNSGKKLVGIYHLTLANLRAF